MSEDARMARAVEAHDADLEARNIDAEEDGLVTDAWDTFLSRWEEGVIRRAGDFAWEQRDGGAS